MAIKLIVSLSIYALIALVGCSNQNLNPTSSLENETQYPLDQTISLQALPGQTGILDSGYFRGFKIYYQRINGNNVLEGDMVIRDNEISKTSPLAKTKSCVLYINLWPSSTVYYTINNDVFNKTIITDAITQFEMKTNLIFVPRTNQADYVNFQKGGVSQSIVGKAGGMQAISLANWATTGTAIHEIGHAVNLFHEHMRADRDKWICIKWDNIDPKYYTNFYQWFYWYDFTEAGNQGTYDLNSIMHYQCKIASVANGGCAIDENKPVITRSDGITTWTTNTSNLSNGDIDGLNSLYGPSRPQYQGYTLTSGQLLHNGEYLWSQNGKYLLWMQRDGNLVLYNWTTFKPIWYSNTYNKPVVIAIMQSDGNFVEYDINNKFYWASNTQNNSGAYLVVQDDGNCVIYNKIGSPKWATNTVGK